MTEFGYKISSEEHGPHDLVAYAQRAESVGFTFAAVSDHFHPWTSTQGHSPFVWSLLGAIGQSTNKLNLLTGVTCPMIRMHPAIIAHAAATTAALMPGRFTLGVGSGENLNEHITGARWPEVDVRLEMLEEAVAVMRLLLEGGLKSHHGKHYTVENARLYDLPEGPIPVAVAASGEKAVKLAAKIGDGLVSVAPDPDLADAFKREAGEDKPRYVEVNVCWAEDEASARATVQEWWPVAGFKGQLMQELALPSLFEAGAEMLHQEDIIETVACGPDPEVHLSEIRKFVDAGYDKVWIHQIGPDQDGFFDFYESRILPQL
ncbi:MAG: TIGR03557 family F420-dependent LLM class oxidoreductase [Actinomycetota bacterium]|nr:TIGR03557 family F420-dependent LLM class oxidoreductase [Actinomycetota bacterium]